MKKKVLIIILVLLVLFFPIKFTYMDGGSREYIALTYKITCFHRIDTYYKSGYLEGCSVHLFPTNFRSIDYYAEEDVHPDGFQVISDINSVNASIGSFNWCNNYGKCESREVLLANDFEAYKYVQVYKDNNVKFITNNDITSLIIYKDSFDNRLDIDIEYDLEHLKCDLDEGKYVVEVNAKKGDNTVTYYFGLYIK